jgi:hypothetical protein
MCPFRGQKGDVGFRDAIGMRQEDGVIEKAVIGEDVDGVFSHSSVLVT